MPNTHKNIDSAENLSRNQRRYDEKYTHVTSNDLVKRIQNLPEFLRDATTTDTSWVGLYKKDFQNHVSQKRILELGSGNGLNSLVMAALDAKHVVAVDLAMPEDAIRDAAKALLLNNIELRVGDFTQMEFDKKFDLVVGKAFLHHLTVNQEEEYLDYIAKVLEPEGEARFFEPATNSKLLTQLQFLVPVPGRPSLLQKHAFKKWKASDPHPDRTNSSRHYQLLGQKFFEEVEIIPIGGIERLHRLLPQGPFNRKFRRVAYRLENVLPKTVQSYIARSQTIIYRKPKKASRRIFSNGSES